MAMGLAAAMTLSMAACGGSGSADTTAAAADSANTEGEPTVTSTDAINRYHSFRKAV